MDDSFFLKYDIAHNVEMQTCFLATHLDKSCCRETKVQNSPSKKNNRHHICVIVFLFYLRLKLKLRSLVEVRPESIFDS